MARPRIYKERVARTVRLEPDIIRFYKQFGKGNFNEGVRRLALEAMALESLSIIDERIAELYAFIEQNRRIRAEVDAEIERLESLKRALEERTDG